VAKKYHGCMDNICIVILIKLFVLDLCMKSAVFPVDGFEKISVSESAKFEVRT